MRSILNEIVDKLKNSTFSVTVPSANIIDAYPVTNPDFKKPYITVDESVNLPDMNTYTNKEENSYLGYQIDVYSRQQKINNVMYSAKDVTKQLVNEIDNILNTEFGLIRSTSPQYIPFSEDRSICRCVVRYDVNLDLTHDYLYRR